MRLILQVIGGMVVLVFALALIAFFVLRWKIRKLAQEMSGFTNMGNGFAGGPPDRLSLHVAEADAWDAEEVQNDVRRFDDLGFQRISAYETSEIPGLIFLPFASPEQNCYAVVYSQVGGFGTWCDIFTKYQDGTTLTVTSAPRGGELEHRPGNEKAYLPGSDVEQLVEVHRSKLQNKPIRPATIEGFVQEFEQAYEEEMAWRNTKGYSEAEVRAVAALDGGNVSEDVIQQTHEALNAQTTIKLRDAIRRNYMEEGGLSAAEWEEQRDRLIIVHERLTPDDLMDEVSEWLEIDDEEYDQLYGSTTDARMLMDRINESQPAALKFKKLRSVDDPIEADLWLAPKWGTEGSHS